MATPNIGLPEMPAGTFQPSVPFNEAMQIIDALLPLMVEAELNTPPTTVAGDAGKRWAVGSSPTGAWVGHSGDIALCVGANLWDFIEPLTGIELYNKSADEYFYYDGSSWQPRVGSLAAANIASFSTFTWTGSIDIAVGATLNLGTLSLTTDPDSDAGVTIVSNLFKFPPKAAHTPIFFRFRINGSLPGAGSAREFYYEMRRPDLTTVVGAENIVKIDGTSIGNRDKTLVSYARGVTDPFAVDGIALFVNNTSGQILTLSSVTLIIQRIGVA